MSLTGRTAIVTGSGHGIGKEYAAALAKEGAKVVVCDIDGLAASKTGDELARTGAKVAALEVDVSKEESVQKMARTAFESFGGVDILVNNAALFATLPRKPFNEISVDEWDTVINVNLKGSFLCSKAVFPYMKEKRYGKIVNISSNTAIGGGRGRCHYVSSKAGVIGLTRALARELGEYNITVNAVAPGITVSERYHPDEKTLAARNAEKSIKRNESPADLIGTVIFLCSRESDFITGQTILVDGGQFFL